MKYYLSMQFVFNRVFVGYSITKNVDNIGGIFLSESTSVSQQKNHINVNFHFICDCIEDITMKIIINILRRKYCRSVYQ